MSGGGDHAELLGGGIAFIEALGLDMDLRGVVLVAGDHEPVFVGLSTVELPLRSVGFDPAPEDRHVARGVGVGAKNLLLVSAPGFEDMHLGIFVRRYEVVAQA